MGFSFPYRVRPVNLWVLSLVNIYRSIMGVVNIVFTASMLMLAFRFWMNTGLPIRILIVAAILFFPVFQPLMIFLRSRKIVGAMPDNMHIDFDNKGLTITVENQTSNVLYSDLKSVIRIYGMLILYTKKGQGYILDKQMLENQGAELFNFLKKHVKSKR